MKLRKADEPTAIDDEIKSVLDEMSRKGPLDEVYPDLLEKLERLYKLKASNRPERVSQDTLWMVGGNVFLGFLMVAYEQKHVMTSKAQSLIKLPWTDRNH